MSIFNEKKKEKNSREKNEWNNEKEIAIVVSDYNADITHKMLKICVILLQDKLVKIYEIIHVRGVLEAPLIVKKLLKNPQISGILVLGAVIQGDTAHDELVAFTAVDKMVDLSLEYDKPVTFGISGPQMNRGQAIARIEPATKHAVDSLLHMLDIIPAINTKKYTRG